VLVWVLVSVVSLFFLSVSNLIFGAGVDLDVDVDVLVLVWVFVFSFVFFLEPYLRTFFVFFLLVLGLVCCALFLFEFMSDCTLFLS